MSNKILTILRQLAFAILYYTKTESDSPPKVNAANEPSKLLANPMNTRINSVILFIVALIILWMVNPELFYFLKEILFELSKSTTEPQPLFV